MPSGKHQLRTPASVGRDIVMSEGKLFIEWGTITKGTDTANFSPSLKQDPRPHFIPHLQNRDDFTSHQMTWFLSITEIRGYVSKIDEWTDGLQGHLDYLLQNVGEPTTAALNYLQSIKTAGLTKPQWKCYDATNKGSSHVCTTVIFLSSWQLFQKNEGMFNFWKMKIQL